MDRETRREIIMDNYEHPMHRGLIEDDSYLKGSTKSDSCIDRIDMMMKIEDGIIKDVVFDGEACAICTSTTSILIKKLIGLPIDKANVLIKNFKAMINEEEYDRDLLGELMVYEDLCYQPNRKNCALLPTDTAKKILDQESVN